MKRSKKSLLFALTLSAFTTITPLTLPTLPTLPNLPTVPANPLTAPTVTLPTQTDIENTLHSVHAPTVTLPGVTGTPGHQYPTLTTASVTTDPIILPTSVISNSDTNISIQVMPISTHDVHIPTPQETFHAVVPNFNLNIQSFPSINENNIDNINTQPLHLIDATTPEALLSSDGQLGSISDLIVNAPTITGPVYTINGPEFNPAPEIIDPNQHAIVQINSPAYSNTINA